MNQKNIIALPKKSKNQINYEKFNNITRDILEPFNIDYDVVEVVHQDKDIYGIKVFIEKSGSYIINCNKKDYKDFLKDVIKKIQDNPSLCPFCKEPNPTDKCDKCNAIFMDSTSFSGNENYLINYREFSEFSKIIEKKTFISNEVIRNYIRLSGDLTKIFNGVDVIYKFDTGFPTFCIEKDVSIKDFEEIDQDFLNILIISFIVSSNEKYSIINISENYMKENFAFKFKDKNTNLNIILYFEISYLFNDDFSYCLKIGIENDIETYLNLFFPEKKLVLSENLEEEYEKLSELMMDLNYSYETQGYELYFTFDVNDIENLNLSYKKGIKEISNLYINYIDNCIDKALFDIKNSLLEII